MKDVDVNWSLARSRSKGDDESCDLGCVVQDLTKDSMFQAANLKESAGRNHRIL